MFGVLRGACIGVAFGFICMGAKAHGHAQGGAQTDLREQTLLTGAGWQFTGTEQGQALPEIGTSEYAQAKWTDVSVPHIFETRAHYNAPEQGWYKRNLNIGANAGRKRTYIVFEGVTTVADVYVNGKLLGEHKGAYTRFLYDITDAVHPGADNLLAVKVDNRPQSLVDHLPDVAMGLYKLWGGINRKVWLLTTGPVGIDPTDFASPGVYITPTGVSEKSAKLEIEVLLRNTLGAAQNVTTTATLLDPDGKAVQKFTPKIAAKQTNLEPGQRVSVKLDGTVDHPRLWALLAPQLYHVRVDVMDASGKVVDSVTQPTGFRTVEFRIANPKVRDTEKWIYFNGKKTALYGVDLHPEVEEKGNAVSDQDLIDNFDVMADLGINFLRLPHYPHAQLEYDECDKRGILCWPEDGHTHNENYGPLAEQIITEMIKQNYNHPSLPVWGLGNESKVATAEASVPLAHKLDPHRPAVAVHMRCDACDFTGNNEYPGWYAKGSFRDYMPHAYIMEIGAGGVITTHTDYNQADWKVSSYEPEEYQQLLAEYVFTKAFDPANDKVGIFTWWIMREFSDQKYKGKIGINSKGLETYAGEKKDVYYLYRSFLRPNVPTVRLTSQTYFLRRGAVNNGIKAYSNANALTLTLNREKVSTLANGQYTQPDGPYLLHTPPQKANQPAPPPMVIPPAPHARNVFYWPVPLRTGRNVVSVTDGLGHSDTATIYFYGKGGAAEQVDRNAPVRDLKSTNDDNPAYLMNMPVHAQWPLYYDLDSTADNSWSHLPAAVEGASWIALRRVTKPGQDTTVSFTATRAEMVYVAESEGGATAGTTATVPAGFAAVDNGSFIWRDNALQLVPAKLFGRKVAAGESVSLKLGDADAVVLVKAER